MGGGRNTWTHTFRVDGYDRGIRETGPHELTPVHVEGRGHGDMGHSMMGMTYRFMMIMIVLT